MRVKIVTSSDSRNCKSPTKSFQVFLKRKGNNALNLLIPGYFLKANQYLFFHIHCASLLHFNEVLKFDEGICKYLSKMRKENLANHRYHRVVLNFTAKERYEFIQDGHYKPKVKRGRKKNPKV